MRGLCFSWKVILSLVASEILCLVAGWTPWYTGNLNVELDPSLPLDQFHSHRRLF